MSKIIFPEFKTRPIKGIECDEDMQKYTLTRLTLREANIGNKNAYSHRKAKSIIYIEVTSGFKGTQTDMREKFTINEMTLPNLAKRKTPITRGPLKGKMFMKLEEYLLLKEKPNLTLNYGKVYKEVNTGFTGTYKEMRIKYPGFTPDWIKRTKITKTSKYPECKWVVI